MTDQPETVEEYRYRKLHTLVKTSTYLIVAVQSGVGIGVAKDSDPGIALAFAVPLVLASVYMLRSGLKDIERPNERPQEVPADD